MSNDPAMLGGTKYDRSPLDFYPSPPRTVNSLLSIIEDDLEGMQFWEPFAGNGAIYNIISPFCRQAGATDITRYEGFDPHGLLDFFSIYPEGEEYERALYTWEKNGRLTSMPVTLADVESLLGFRPDCIISNPPYGKLTDKSVKKALELMEAEKGFVAFLMRHEWDAAKTRAPLLDHPAFLGKITLRYRPVWIEKKEGEKSASPRFSYAWFLWDWSKALTAPGARPQMFYAS